MRWILLLILFGCSSGSGKRGELAGERERIMGKAAEVRRYVGRKGFNLRYCFLVDMRVPSGKNRFFVYDLKGDSVVIAGLVAHGSGGSIFSEHPTFSNDEGSGCTSLGRYRVGFPYRGQFGRAYKLYGLDATNDHAFARNVVLHSYWQVPERETYPAPICNSLGCTMVAPGFLARLGPLIDGASRPILLEVFY